MLTQLIIAFRNLFQAKRRTLLLGSAIAFVSLLLLLLLSISKGVSNKLIEASTLTSTGHVNIAGFYKQRANSATPSLRIDKKSGNSSERMYLALNWSLIAREAGDDSLVRVVHSTRVSTG